MAAITKKFRYLMEHYDRVRSEVNYAARIVADAAVTKRSEQVQAGAALARGEQPTIPIDVFPFDECLARYEGALFAQVQVGRELVAEATGVSVDEVFEDLSVLTSSMSAERIVSFVREHRDLTVKSA
jgi:hypothetical protein